MNSRIWTEGGELHVALSPEEALEIAQALLKAADEYPECEFQVQFTEESGGLKWFVKARPPRTAR